MNKTVLLLLPTVVLTGCASLAGTDPADAHRIAIDKVDSSLATIRMVTVTPSEAGIRVRGDLTRKPASRGPVYGHVHIEVLGADDQTLLARDTRQRRRNAKSRSVQFSEYLAVDPATVTFVRITHHSPWQP